MSKITELQVHIVNVNHGDCIVIIGKDQSEPVYSMVIDGGSGGMISTKILTDAIDFPRTPETEAPIIHKLIASHHDRDHLGGLVKILGENNFTVVEAWMPVLFNPPGIPWLSVADHTTFTEQAIENPERASGLALSKIQNLARDAMLNANPEELETADLAGTLMQKNFMSGIPSDISDNEVATKERVEMQDEVSEVIGETISAAQGTDLDFLRNLTKLGSRVPGVTGCGAFGDRETELEQLDGASKLEMFAEKVDDRRIHRAWSGIGDDVYRFDQTAIAMMATRAAYNVGLTTKFIKLCRAQNIEMVMPLTRRKKLRPQDTKIVADGISMTQLAPTYELVEEKKEKLMPPEGVFAFKALTHTVTVPNKVSYVIKLEMGESSVLLTGDSGFTDFYNWRKKEFDEIRLAEMSKCQLVKVPHHGGHFEYWGKCVRKLLNDNKPVGEIFVTSLGSAHKNPSFEFEDTAVLIRQANQDAEFHFTNPPVKERFDDVCEDCSDEVPAIITYSTNGDGHWSLMTGAIRCEKYRV